MNIGLVRKSRLMTQAEVAKRLGVSRTTVTMWESGKSLPRGKTLIKLASVLECTVDELIAQ